MPKVLSREYIIAHLPLWREDPIAFFEDVIPAFKPNKQQSEVVMAIAQVGAWASIKSGHGVGKTSTLACVGLWFLSVFSDAKVPITSPSKEQLKNTFWPEFRKWHKEMAEPFKSDIDITAEKVSIKSRPDTFAVARTARKENPDALQGFHAEHLLFLVDEASGVPAKIFEVAMGALTTVDTRFALTGNPALTSGFFYDTHNKEGMSDEWIKLTISCINNSNVDPTYPAKIASQYGENSDQYRVRVLGEFPLQSAMQFIGEGLITDAIKRYLEVSNNPEIFKNEPKILGVDVARFGDDSSCVYLRQGLWSKMLLHEQLDTYALRRKVQNYFVDYHADLGCIDVGGVGAGVYDGLYNKGYPVSPVNFGSVAFNTLTYKLRRDEMWGEMKGWLKRGGAIEDIPQLKSDLKVPTYTYTVKEQTVLESKSSMKLRGEQSPDIGDALGLTFAEPWFTTINEQETRCLVKTSDDVPIFN